MATSKGKGKAKGRGAKKTFRFNAKPLRDRVVVLKRQAKDLVTLAQKPGAKVTKKSGNVNATPKTLLKHLENALLEIESNCSGPQNPMDLEFTVESGG